MIVLIDAGHGGSDPGACEIEAQINLEVSFKLSRLLKDLDHEVYMTRTDDEDMSLASRIAEERFLKPDCFLSIHCNAATTKKAHGFEVWTSKGETQSDRIADNILKSHIFLMPDRRTRVDQSDGDLDKEAHFYVLKNTMCPAVLVELGFVSNNKEREWLKTDNAQRTLSLIIASGLLAWRG